MIGRLTGFPSQLTALPIVHLRPVSDPPHLPFLILHHREDSRFHAVIEEGVSFGHVDYVEFDCCPLGYVPCTEEEPLVVAFGVYVVLENEVVFVVLPLVDFVEIAGLEVGVEIDLRLAD